MGNSPSQEGGDGDLLSNNLVFERQVNNEHYGEVKVYKMANSTLRFALKQKFCTSKPDLDQALGELKALKALAHPNLIQIGDIKMQHEDQLCSNVFLLQYFYEFHDLTLHEEVSIRGKSAQTYSQEQILSYLYQIVSTLKYLAEREIFHESLQPKNILLDEAHNIKLYIPASLSG